ncbi:YbdD/YjiX family protein [Phytohabitans sp. ZYX-F-186]|uniref:YbdD/YjiX family protein n=1 Tax=Phytohabitans maris TaxID=3071409 RepID=A0ABU0ZP05_9ACTN|nr:YbdD/YjiX family protein [Phytohabitans sp. ZYX-F-186]MDQ7908436.1 YbdD/YjiX family protein [Phytohabitans sp. ZYX-F-186]
MRRALAALRWYFRELSGEAEYDHYVDRHRRLHPEQPLMTRREFEHCRTDRRDETPTASCC